MASKSACSNFAAPKVRDLEAIDKISGETVKTVMLIANLAEWTPVQVHELDAADCSAASKAVAEMLGNSRRAVACEHGI